MFGRKKKEVQGSAPSQSYAPAPMPPGDPGLPGLAGYIHQGKLPGRGKNAMPPNRFNFKRPDGRPD